ncbi:hypothetical protein [Caballeronia sp. dw_19]|jgi:hypothetical protein|uniref:hypothetical protein n=1 Tax=unclassified Caballeronia TaxID=2646786 RepID=UPI001BD5FD1A|nr:hypothetical protein [Caballeronia sp. dw_19]
MKPVTVDILRAHLMAASLTAMGAEALILLVLLVLPVSEETFSSTPFRLLALALIVSGVIVIRRLAHAAFEQAVQRRYVTTHLALSRPVSVTTRCPRRGLVILHLRLTGRPFVLASH